MRDCWVLYESLPDIGGSDFWSLTPASFAVVVEGRTKALVRRQADIIHLAWRTEMYARSGKNFPRRLADELPAEAKPPQRRKTPAEVRDVLNELRAHQQGVRLAREAKAAKVAARRASRGTPIPKPK